MCLLYSTGTNCTESRITSAKRSTEVNFCSLNYPHNMDSFQAHSLQMPTLPFRTPLTSINSRLVIVSDTMLHQTDPGMNKVQSLITHTALCFVCQETCLLQPLSKRKMEMHMQTCDHKQTSLTKSCFHKFGNHNTMQIPWLP